MVVLKVLPGNIFLGSHNVIISKLWRHQYAGIESWEITDDILYFICGKHVLHVSARLFLIAPF